MKKLFEDIDDKPLHARAAPSSASRWVKCPGSIQMAAGKEDTAGSAAKEGTLAHLLAEKMLLTGIRKWSEVQQAFPNEPFTEDMFEHTLAYCKYVESLNLTDVKVEYKTPLFYSPEETGTVDATGVDHYNVLHVVDLKYGRGVFVEVKDNLQLIIYAVSTLDQLQGKENITSVNTHIFQPRMQNIAFAEYTREQLEEFRIKISEAEKQTWAANPTLNPTKKNCIWCKAKATCPAVARKAVESIGGDFENLDSLATVCSKDPKEMSEGQLVTILQAKELVTAWLKSVEDHIIKALSDGTIKFHGAALKRRRGRKVWKDEDQVVMELVNSGNNHLLKTAIPTPLQTISALKKKKTPVAFLDEFILEKEGALTVVLEKSA